MARKPRLHVPGGLYHVILRANARQDMFFTAGDRRYFYELLAEGVARFGYRVQAFCLMTQVRRQAHVSRLPDMASAI